MTTDLLIHPGFHKTGTSWLQEHLFKDQRLFASLLKHVEVDRYIVRPHDFLFDGEKARTLITQRANAVSQDVVPVLSSEILVGNPLFGSRDAKVIADRLQLVASKASILLTVRSQPTMMRSLFQQYLKRGGTLPADRFFDRTQEPGYFGFDPDLLSFDLFADHYADLFGKSRVLVLPQELLASDPRRFVDYILRFMGRGGLPDEVELAESKGTARSFPPGGTPLVKVANYLRPSALNPGGPMWSEGLANILVRAAYRVSVLGERESNRWRAAIVPFNDKFGQSNARLQQFCPVELRQYGYKVAV